MSIPKINFTSIKTKVTTLPKNVKDLASKGFSFAKTTAIDTVHIAKNAPGHTAVIAGAGAVATLGLIGLAKLAKAGVEKIAENKYN